MEGNAVIDTRFLLDKSDCVDDGEGCKAEMRASDNGAFTYYVREVTLEDQAHELAYYAILELGLHRELENSEWDSLAEEYAAQILNDLKEKIGKRFIEIGEQRRELQEVA